MEKKKNKFKIDKGQLAVRVMAGILAALMVVSVLASLVYYLIANYAN